MPRKRRNRLVVMMAVRSMCRVGHMVGHHVLELQGMDPTPKEQAHPSTEDAQLIHRPRR